MFKWQSVLQKTLLPEVLDYLLHPFSENKICSYDIPGRWLSSLTFKISFHNFSTQTVGNMVLADGKLLIFSQCLTQNFHFYSLGILLLFHFSIDHKIYFLSHYIKR